MKELPASVQPFIRRLKRRLAVGLFLDNWPRWAVGSLFVAGCVAIACRLFFESASELLAWLWIAPLVASVPAIIICYRKRYRPVEIVALADSLNGGHGTMLSLFETGDAAWQTAVSPSHLSRLAMPRVRPWRRLSMLAPAIAFLAAALLLPQRTDSAGSSLLANDMAADLQSMLAELKVENVVAPEEEQQLQEEIERIRKDAIEKMDASSWEASDALRERMAANLSEKQDAIKWAQESLARYGAASAAGAGDSSNAAAADELGKAIEKLAQSGLLANAPEELQKLLGGKNMLAGGNAQLPADKEALRELASQLASYLARRDFRLSDIAQRGRESGRFDTSAFPLFSDIPGPDSDGDPGEGGINRGRGDADLTWGQETQPYDRFKAVPLPPGSVRGPDDWSPVAVLPAAPQVSPEDSASSPARTYTDTTGQSAWRRTLAPRHYSAVKKYFENSDSER